VPGGGVDAWAPFLVFVIVLGRTLGAPQPLRRCLRRALRRCSWRAAWLAGIRSFRFAELLHDRQPGHNIGLRSGRMASCCDAWHGRGIRRCARCRSRN